MFRIKYLLLLVALSGCIRSDEITTQVNPDYFDLRELLLQQMTYLDSVDARVKKIAVIEGIQDSILFTPDSAQWASELKLFLEAGINKPVLRNQYAITDTAALNSNLSLRKYRYIGDSKSAVEFMHVYYLDSLKNVKMVEALYNESNLLYKSGRKIRMIFDDNGGLDARLESFAVEGFQKMIFKDTVSFAIKAGVVY